MQLTPEEIAEQQKNEGNSSKGKILKRHFVELKKLKYQNIREAYGFQSTFTNNRI